MNAQSECSRVVCVVRMELYGSTTAVDTRGAGYTENSSFDFLAYSTLRRSISSDVNPDPVPPPKLVEPAHHQKFGIDCQSSFTTEQSVSLSYGIVYLVM